MLALLAKCYQFVCCKLKIANEYSICSALKSKVETIAELCIRRGYWLCKEWP